MLLLPLLVVPLALAASPYPPPAPRPNSLVNSPNSVNQRGPASCFPSLGFTPPTLQGNATAPSVPVKDWWCNLEEENGFLGFVYYVQRIPSVEVCMNVTNLIADFSLMRSTYNARYVRLYNWCDDNFGFFDDVIKAAYQVGIGVYATVWFGFDLTNQWQTRRDEIVKSLQNNPLAPYVIRSIDIGSEPLFDGVLPVPQLIDQILQMQQIAHPLGIGVSLSELQYGYILRQPDGAMQILDVVDFIHAHQLPFFDFDATTSDHSWPSIMSSTDFFATNTAPSKKIMFTETGWPSSHEVWEPNSPKASSSLQDSVHFAELLDNKCEEMKARWGRGGIGWFWQHWEDRALPGWGWVSGRPGEEIARWSFKPRTGC